MQIEKCKLKNANLSSLIKTALKEDIGRGDITSNLIIPPKRRIQAVIVAKEKGVVCGLDVARLVFKTVDKKIRFRAATSDGEKVEAGRILARLEGEARNILKAERAALNFLGRLSGIATLTNKFGRRVAPYRVKIMDTRKTTPGLRVLEKYAVRCAGGFNHRMGLWDQILIKDNHLLVARHWSLVSSKKPLKEIIEKIKQKKPKGVKVEIEVKNLQEFKEAVQALPDIIMLDNFKLKDIRKAVKMRNAIRLPAGKAGNTQYPPTLKLRRAGAIPKLEVSGGVNLSNVRSIAACGAEMISVGELTHSARALDLALNCE
ncbi:MAG: carboxylating nicotinate-nucleotide diphosphorylase [Candidatus Omnitrophica bacterium]|nr:carboxylating nicotinate-nucleotide diphosphorylase [Candidatus Omnitrophota bacterium]